MMSRALHPIGMFIALSLAVLTTASAQICEPLFAKQVAHSSRTDDVIRFSHQFAASPEIARIDLLREFAPTRSADISLLSPYFIAVPWTESLTSETAITLLAHGIYPYASTPTVLATEVSRIRTIDHALMQNLEAEYRPVGNWLQSLLTGIHFQHDRFLSPAYAQIQNRLQILTVRLQMRPEEERKAAFEVLNALLQVKPRFFFGVLRCPYKLSRDSFRFRELKLKLSLWEIAKAAFQNPKLFMLGLHAVETAAEGI